MSVEKFLALPGGRTLAYEDAGNVSSSTIVIFFHGAFSVGNAKHTSPVLLEKDVHFIAPTLPGWGNSSSPARDVSFSATIASDTAALIDHLHPNLADTKLYIGGGSYGTVAAQMLYGASFDMFPPGRNLTALLLVGTFSPFHCDTDYTKCMSWANYISVGPPSRLIPYKLVPRLVKMVMQRKLHSQEGAEAFLREFLFGKMDEAELRTFKEWQVAKGREDGQLEHEMAENVLRSVSKTWEGFLACSDVLHSDYGGFSPSELDEEHSRRPILVVASKGDDMAPEAWAQWVAKNYRNAQLKMIEGGHIAAIFHFDEIWDDFLKL